MKYFCIIFLLLGLLSESKAQFASASRFSTENHFRKVARSPVMNEIATPIYFAPTPGVGRRTTGMILTFVGTAFVIGGALVLVDSADPSYSSADESAEATLGLAAVVLGLGATTTGVILWITGSAKANKSRSQKVMLSPKGNGLALSLRF